MNTFKSSRRCGIENCRSRRYHVGEDGYTYCENSHRQDVGLIIGEDDYREGVSQSYAETTRIQKEKLEAAKTYLEGREGMILYLQCFQFIFWKQITWLIKVKDYPKELETVARDLWTLRIHLLRTSIESPDDQRASQVFSTQSDTDDTDVEHGVSSASQAKLYKRAPRIIETLALCYLTFTLLRIPVYSGQLREWIVSKDFVYLKALRDLPSSMKTKLHPKMRYSLDARTGQADLEVLHRTIFKLTLAFKHSFGMEFPAINHHLLLFRFISALGLPLDLFSVTESLVRLLNLEFSYSIRSPRRKRPLLLSEHPEIALLCTLMIAVKLLYPFDSDVVTRNPTTSDSPTTEIIDWNAWNAARAAYREAFSYQDATEKRHTRSSTPNNPPQSQSNRTSPDRTSHPWLATTEQDAMHMTPSEMDSYLTWFNETLIDLPRDEDGEETGARWFLHPDSRSAVTTEFRRFLFRMFPTTAPLTTVEQEIEVDEMEIDSDADANSLYEEGQPPNGPLDSAAKAHIERIEAVQKSLQHRTPIPESQDGAEETAPLSKGKARNDPKRRIDKLLRRPGSMYRHYRSSEQIPACAEMFFHDAAALVGIKIEDLVRALFNLENVMRSWVDKERGRFYYKHARDEKNVDEPHEEAGEGEGSNS